MQPRSTERVTSALLPNRVRDNAAWDFLGQLAGKTAHAAFLLDIAQDRKPLFHWELFRKWLWGRGTFSPCKAVDAGSVPIPASKSFLLIPSAARRWPEVSPAAPMKLAVCARCAFA